MNKVTVTKAEMEAIEIQRDKWNHYLKVVLEFKQNGNFRNEVNRSLNEMTIEQIVLAWHGYAEIEPEYAGFDEAMKALSKGETTYYHYTLPSLFDGEEGLEKTLKINLGMKPSYFGSAMTWEDLVKARFMIKKEELND